MQEMSVQSKQVPLLLPGSTQRPTALAEAPPSPPLQSELHRFLDLVICDGRYLNEVATDPRLVADWLGFDLSAETEAELRAKSLEQHVAGLYVQELPAAVIPVSAIGIVVIPVAVAVVAGIAYVRYSSPKRTEMVSDRSPRANLKL
jgi:hypothetical protein